MPELDNAVPVLREKVPSECRNHPKSMEEETSEVPNTAIPDIDVFVREHIWEIMSFIRQKCEDKNVTAEELQIITKIAHTSFFRLWKFGKAEEELDEEELAKMKVYKPNADHVCRLCLAIGISLDEFQRMPTGESTVKLPALREDSHEEIMDSFFEEFNRQKNIIETLTYDNSRKSDRIVELDVELKRRIDEFNELQRSSTERIAVLTDALIERHDQMHQLNRDHGERIDRLDTALRMRYDQLYELFMMVLGNDPQKVKELLKVNEKNS